MQDAVWWQPCPLETRWGWSQGVDGRMFHWQSATGAGEGGAGLRNQRCPGTCQQVAEPCGDIPLPAMQMRLSPLLKSIAVDFAGDLTVR